MDYVSEKWDLRSKKWPKQAAFTLFRQRNNTLERNGNLPKKFEWSKTHEKILNLTIIKKTRIKTSTR